MKKLWLKTSLALAVGAVSTHSLGNGIAINEQSVSGMGTSFAGRASAVNDASILFGNPAGLSKLERPEVVGGFGLVKANVDIDDASAETHKGDMVPLTPVPFAYYASPIDEKFSWGLGLYVPYALISDYEKSFGGRFKGQYSKVEVVTLQPTLSYQINDRVSVGFGPTINKIKGKLVNKLDNSAAFGTGETKVGIKGDDVAYGFNVGLMVDVTDSLTWGLTYHSKVDYTLEGRTRITNGSGPIFSQFNGDYDASLDFTKRPAIAAQESDIEHEGQAAEDHHRHGHPVHGRLLPVGQRQVGGGEAAGGNRRHRVVDRVEGRHAGPPEGQAAKNGDADISGHNQAGHHMRARHDFFGTV